MNERPLISQEPPVERTERIITWIRKQEHLLSVSDGVKVELNIKGRKVIGKITLSPEE